MISANDWEPSDGMKLEPNAFRAAKETKNCLALTAGPGAGKTEMLAQRADFLLNTGSCRYPKRILAISFKVDASVNLKERVYRRCGSELGARFDSYTFHALAKRIIDRFRVLLTGSDSLDADYTIGDKKIPQRQVEFGELVPLAINILSHSLVARNAIRQTYSDVFLDEFQDCTSLQYELVKIAFQNVNVRLTAVGDTKQKIMDWAGALDGIFEKFAKDFTAVPLNMYLNFRSKPVLLRLQNEIINVLDPGSAMPENQLVGDEGSVSSWRFKSSHLEADYLADVIRGWIDIDKIPLSEIAILVSKQIDLYAIDLMSALKKRGIPYRNEQQMQDITVEPAARLIVDYLTCLYVKTEPEAWIRLMTQLTPFTDDESQSKARQNINRLVNKQRKEMVTLEVLEERYIGWWSFAKEFIELIGIETFVALSPDYESRDRLVQIIKDTKTKIEEFLSADSELINVLKNFSDDQSIRILTIHKSKGLEFHSVIIMAVEDEIFFGDKDANRCAFFVGVSRAKERLVLTCADYRDRPSGFSGNWRESRTPQNEYFGYAAPFLKQQEKNL